MDKQKLRKLALDSLPALLLVLATFVAEIFLGNLSLSAPVLIVILIVSSVSVIAAFLFLNNILHLVDKTERLQQGLEELYKHRAVFVSDEALKDIELRATKIRIVSPDLTDDLDSFYKTVLQNISAQKTYEYIIPEKQELISKMDRLMKHLCKDAYVVEAHSLPVRYKVCSDYPIIAEYIIYDSPEFDGLRGFVELHLGPSESDNTNVPLDDASTHQLNHWFDKVFHED